MNKVELTQYLVNLNTLMKAQDAAANPVSTALATEYTKCWVLLKAEIQQEHEKDEARKSKLERLRSDEVRTDVPSSERGRSEPDRGAPREHEYEPPSRG